MNIFETISQTQLLAAEGNRQLTQALVSGLGGLMRRLGRAAGTLLSHVPNEHLG